MKLSKEYQLNCKKERQWTKLLKTHHVRWIEKFIDDNKFKYLIVKMI